MESEKLLIPGMGTHNHGDLPTETWSREQSIHRLNRYGRVYVVFLHVVLVFMLLSSGLFYSRVGIIKASLMKPWTPLSVGSVISEEHSVDHDRSTKYSGFPTRENTKSWEDLIQPTFLGASEDELRAANESVTESVKLADDDGYLAALGVYHELHCLRQLRLYLYRDTYFANLTEANIEWMTGHLDHCIETLRISIMCNADLSLYTFYWKTREENRPHAKSNSKRVCINWKEVDQWSMKRKVSLWPRLVRKGGNVEKIHL